MSEEENKKSGFVSGESQQHYGTFQGVANYAPPGGFPQPVPPPGATAETSTEYYSRGYQAVPVAGYAVVEGRPVRERRLPCCGIGFGWFLFVVGFVLAGVPWYAGALIMLCSRIDYREKPGYIACTVGAIILTIALVFGLTKGADDW